MRKHCRTQHGFDPMPAPANVKVTTVRRPELVTGTNTIGPSDTTEKFLKMMRDFLTIQELGFGLDVKQVVSNSVGFIDKALNYLMDNYVILRKTDVSGISGHVCGNCLTFQFQYIKNIGFDLTARERHRCIPSMVHEASKLQDKITRHNYLRMQ